MLRLRVLTGIVAVPTTLLLATLGGEVLGGLPFVATVVLVAAVGTGELLALLQRVRRRPLWVVAILLSVAFPLDAFLAPGRLIVSAIAAAVMVSLVAMLPRAREPEALVDWALGLAAPLYVGGMLQFFVLIRFGSGGLFWVPAILIASWVCDATAFFLGRARGRTPLAPLVSPAKSVEGAVSGVLAAGIVTPLAVLAVQYLAPEWAGAHGIEPLVGVALGLTVGLASVLGDLAESFLKRQTSAKDSGVIMPGHGGLLDRIDSLLFSAAAGWALLTLLR